MTRTLSPDAIAEAVRSLYTIGGVYDYLAEAVQHQGGQSPEVSPAISAETITAENKAETTTAETPHHQDINELRTK